MTDAITAPRRPEPDDEGVAFRPRMSIGKKIVLGVFLFLLSLFLLHWWWGVKTGSALEAEIAKYHARGEPVRMEDFKYDEVLAEQNAALDLRAAARAMKLTPEQTTALGDWSVNLELPDEQVALLRELLAEQAEILEDVREARGKGGVDWGVRLKSPMISILLPDLSEQRQLGQLLLLAADMAHRDGDDKASMAYMDDVGWLGRAMAKHPTLVGHMIAEALGTGLMCAFIWRNGHELKVGGRQGAARGELEKVIRDLLDESTSKESMRRALVSERAMQLDTAELLASGKLSLANLSPAMGAPAPAAPIQGALLRPLMRREALIMMRSTTRVIDALKEETWLGAKRKGAFEAVDTVRRHPMSLLVRLMMPAFQSAMEHHFRRLAERRIAAGLLAIRLYQLDHDGKHPQSWNDLVPEYLPSMPADPFAADGRGLTYQMRPEGPVIYSVGSDAQDDGGSEMAKRTGQKARNAWGADDAVFRFVPPPRATAETGR